MRLPNSTRALGRTSQQTLLAAAVFLAGCHLLTEGQGDSPSDSEDAGSISSPASECDLACTASSHCELHNQTPVCVADDAPGKADAGATTQPPPPPKGACNLACTQGRHCVVEAQGPACVLDSTPAAVDASTPAKVDAGPPAAACNLACVVGKHCAITPQGATCVPDKPAVIDASVPVTTPCGAKTCGADEQCCSASCGICEPQGGLCPAIACLPDAGPPKVTCASTLCKTGTYCDDITGTPECKPLPSCDTVKCSSGFRCELVQVQCIRAPCPPQPQCVPDAPGVCNLDCKSGTHCVVGKDGPSCVSDNSGPSCGKKTCGANQICCSPSCGICGTAKGACPAIACAPSDGTQ